MLLILLLRFMLASENKRRDTEKNDKFDEIYIPQELPDGSVIEKRVDRAFLDLTDIQNREFRYAL